MAALFRLLRMCALLVPIAVTASVPVLQGCGGGGGDCCRVCSTGKACGDTCIPQSQTCHSSGGCACNG